jgi:N-acetylglucosamine kinase-like BadF-type ATPase
VIAGTGSAAYGERANGEAVRAGGFGYLFGDQGSSFAIARAALAGAMRSSDGGAITNLGEAALGFFDAPDLRALARAVSLGEIKRPQLAGFARVVLDAARLGDADAGTIVDAAAGDLAALAAQVVGQLAAGADAPVPVAFVGGAVENAGLRAGVARRVEAAAPWARVVDPAHEAAFGAALLAFDAAGAARPSA